MTPPMRLVLRTLQSAPRPSLLPPTFLLPMLSIEQTAAFSNTSTIAQRRDRNPDRGVSALRRTGLRKRQTVSVKAENLPKPVLDPARRSKVQTDPEHGLWQFFNPEKTPFATPDFDNAHGRAWTVQELRRKDWEDLHKLWWRCIKERNRLSTEAYERKRVEAGYGDYESEGRDKEVRLTMRAIKHVLTERWYAWEDARKLAKRDPGVNLQADIVNGESAHVEEYEAADEGEQDAIENATLVETEREIAEGKLNATVQEQISQRPEARA